LQLLHAARKVVKTGQSSRNKTIGYTIPEDVKAKVEILYKEAKLWHKVYGRGKASQTVAAEKHSIRIGGGRIAGVAHAGRTEQWLDEMDEDQVFRIGLGSAL